MFHAVHQSWISVLSRALNTGRLSPDYYALIERACEGLIPEDLSEDRIYVRKADRITVRHRHGQIVAVVEIVSPGNKASTNELRTFVEKTSNLIAQGVHLLVVDLFPPSKRDPQGIHKAIWDQFVEEDFVLPGDKRLTLAAYDAGPPPTAYVEPVAVGDTLPDMPIFLKPDFYVSAPLDETYRTTWNEFFPAPVKRLLEPSNGNP
ncbi:MAG: DUF4058 family protein [Isosphaeraceae bacterium]